MEAMHLDCTLRDGGYYNNWDFSKDLINAYIRAMQQSGVKIVEIGFRLSSNKGYKGACAFSKDEFLDKLTIPDDMLIGVMLNGSDLIEDTMIEEQVDRLIPRMKADSKVSLVRIACRLEEFIKCLRAATRIKSKGYLVGMNIMQASRLSAEEIKELCKPIPEEDVDVLYFADSMGSLSPNDTKILCGYFKESWKGKLGIHAHDNRGLALSNTLAAIESGVSWIDSTVMGMGRGPGNARTEELLIELATNNKQEINIISLMSLIREYFEPMKNKYMWGSNMYYYLAGVYSIHPSFIQEMIADVRYTEEDILAVIDYLRRAGKGKTFSLKNLSEAKNFYCNVNDGDWAPEDTFSGHDILLLGTGPGVEKHKEAISSYIATNKPLVIALNTQSNVNLELINYRVACHPVRLLADIKSLNLSNEPIILPKDSLEPTILKQLGGKNILNFGLTVKDSLFEFRKYGCVTPTSLVLSYALAIASSGKANHIYLAGFDGYPPGDQRNDEMNNLLHHYSLTEGSRPLTSIVETAYDVHTRSIYGF